MKGSFYCCQTDILSFIDTKKSPGRLYHSVFRRVTFRSVKGDTSHDERSPFTKQKVTICIAHCPRNMQNISYPIDLLFISRYTPL